jgi:hypothetical protein
LFWAESGPSGKARESLFEVWPRAGRPRNVFWESGPGPAATEPGFCQNGAAASAPRENKVFILMRSLAYMGLFGLYIYISFSYRTQAGRARISLGSRIDPGSGQNEKMISDRIRGRSGSPRLPLRPAKECSEAKSYPRQEARPREQNELARRAQQEAASRSANSADLYIYIYIYSTSVCRLRSAWQNRTLAAAPRTVSRAAS